MLRIVSLLVLLSGLILWLGYREATAMPVLRHADLHLSDWPTGARPISVAFFSDVHMDSPDMPPARVAQIVRQVNAAKPDLVLIAGDFIGDRHISTHSYSTEEAIAPFAGLHAPLGVMAVLGNHDHWRDAAEARAQLERRGLVVLDNEAVRAGPLVIGGLDDDYTGHAALRRTLEDMRRIPGARLMLSHSPDPFVESPAGFGPMLAGHTHCGQIVLPLLGPIATMTDSGRDYACGFAREKGKILLTTAGLGTSLLPLRLGAPPEIWLLRLGPAPRRR